MVLMVILAVGDAVAAALILFGRYKVSTALISLSFWWCTQK